MQNFYCNYAAYECFFYKYCYQGITTDTCTMRTVSFYQLPYLLHICCSNVTKYDSISNSISRYSDVGYYNQKTHHSHSLQIARCSSTALYWQI